MATTHLCGSVNLTDEEEVFRAVAALCGAEAPRMPDGETGERGHWIAWQGPRLAAVPQLERVPPRLVTNLSLPMFRPRAEPADIRLDLGYADAAKSSYAIFRRLKESGVVPPSTRFQISLPTALALLHTFIDPEARAGIEEVFLDHLGAEVAAVADVVPADQLAVQWDVAVEVGLLEESRARRADFTVPAVADALARHGDLVPENVELGFHLCYGDSPGEDGRGHHWLEPADTGLLVEVANAVFASMRRPVTWLHLPVPINRNDDAYFAPLRELRLDAETQLFLGLVHHADGLAGARRRARTAARHVSPFGVATECGLGRVPRDEVLDLLRLHRELRLPWDE
ncbi:hypothetical protein [Amycolatopsis rubida]|uniref:Uncharacterized protein n=1 Tax=Amycolatopsis rubida TaxID=112413 RepID=A0A1I5TLI2_9PSEU|nr:hypothetical protein [Amycolatopsis rubida]SFP83905.1 hypothetical protein SAMN05421854_107151 [Amycolatopsis rubida]